MRGRWSGRGRRTRAQDPADKVGVTATRRQLPVDLEARGGRAPLRPQPGAVPLALVPLPVQAGAPPLPRRQAVEVDAGLEERLALVGHALALRRGRRLG